LGAKYSHFTVLTQVFSQREAKTAGDERIKSEL
jgi:hypothetical protein